MLAGVLTSISESQLEIQGDLGATTVELGRVERLALAGATPTRGVPPLSARIRFAAGSLLTTDTFNWTISAITLNDPSGTERRCAQEQIVAIEVLGGRVVWLSELDPAAQEQTPTFGTAWPLQVNRNVVGGRFMVDRTPFDRGLGVHTRSVLRYTLDGSFSTLQLQVGLDDSSAPHGRANVRVLLDGKPIYEAKGLSPGQLSPPQALPISGGKQLELIAEPADHLDVLGRVDWLGMALLRK